MRAMILKELRELRRDRRTAAMLVALPLILLVIFGYAANFTVTSVTTVVVGPQATLAAARLPAFFHVVSVEPGWTTAQARDLLRDGRAEVAIDTNSTPPAALVDGSSYFVAQSTIAALARAGAGLHVTVLFNPRLKTSWVLVPALVGLILAFIGTIITSIGLVREREAGTLEQLAVMPLRPSDVIAGKIAPYFLIAALDMTLVTVLALLVFGVPFNGNVATFALGSGLFLLTVLGLGVLISTVSQSQGQAIQTAIFVMLPQILLSGMIYPLQSMPTGVRWIGYLLPLTYFITLSRGIMLRGAPIASLWLPLVVLAVMAAVVFGLGVLRFRRDLAPRQRDRGSRGAVATVGPDASGAATEAAPS